MREDREKITVVASILWTQGGLNKEQGPSHSEGCHPSQQVSNVASLALRDSGAWYWGCCRVEKPRENQALGGGSHPQENDCEMEAFMAPFCEDNRKGQEGML